MKTKSEIKLKKYWLRQSKLLKWYVEPKIAFKKNDNNKFDWFPDGRVNVSYNCLETNIQKGFGKQNALICIDKNFKIETYSYFELLNLVENFSSYLKKKLLKINNPTVILQSSAGIDTSIFMLACARIGVRFSIIFEDLHVTAVQTRILLLKPSLFFTVKNNSFIKKLKLSLKKTNIKCKVLKIGNTYKNKENLINFKKLPDIKKNGFKIKFFKPNKSLFVLFTSGSTGIPKGIEHSMGGYLLYSKYTTKKKFGLDRNSKFLCASDAGWINGHTYSIFGPLSIGSTSIILKSPMMMLNEKLIVSLIKKLKVTGVYLPVTIIKIMKAIYKNKKFLSKDIKVIGSMGEPLSDSVGNWFSKLFKSKPLPIVNTYFQTETGGIIYSPSIKDKATKKISVGKSLNNFLKFKNKFRKNKFELELQNPWPGCMKNCVNGLITWKKYWNKKNFKLFDIGSFNNEKNLIIHGRIDDVINVRGHRIGSQEIENVVIKDKDITEVAAVGCDDLLEGNKIILFVSLNDQKYIEKKIKNINKLISNYFGNFAIPKQIYFLSSLPKTRSGKILRRLLRDLYSYSKLDIKKDLSTMINPEVIDEIKKKINENK